MLLPRVLMLLLGALVLMLLLGALMHRPLLMLMPLVMNDWNAERRCDLLPCPSCRHRVDVRGHGCNSHCCHCRGHHRQRPNHPPCPHTCASG